MADMNNKLDNEEFRIIEIDANVLSGDSNKLKLQLASRIAIMSVLEAFLLKKQQEMTNDINTSDRNLSEETLEKEQRKLAMINIRIKTAAEYKERYIELSKKALRFPKENFDDIVELSRELSKVERGQKREIVNAEKTMDSISPEPLSKIDQTAVKESVEEAMRELIKNNDISDSKDIDSVVKEASKVGEKATQLYENKITSNDMDKIFDNVSRKMHGEPAPVQDKPVSESVFDGTAPLVAPISYEEAKAEPKMDDYFKKTNDFENMSSKNVTVEDHNNGFVVPTNFNLIDENREETVDFDKTSFSSTKVDTAQAISKKQEESQEIDFSNDNSLEEYLKQLDELRAESKNMDDQLSTLDKEADSKKRESEQMVQEAKAKEDELIRVKKELLSSAKQQIQQYQTQVDEKRVAINNKKQSIENYNKSIQDSNDRIKNAKVQIERWQSQLGDFTSGNSQTTNELNKGHTK